jgi:hypothetical protein
MVSPLSKAIEINAPGAASPLTTTSDVSASTLAASILTGTEVGV